MRINYKTYPVLDYFNKIKKGEAVELPIYKADAPVFTVYNDFFSRKIQDNLYAFTKEINIVSKAFVDASEKSLEKLHSLWGDIIQNDLSDFSVQGTFIMGDKVFCINYETKQGSEEQNVAFFAYHKSGMPYFMLLDGDSFVEGMPQYWASESTFVKKDKLMFFLATMLRDVIVFSMFKQYAEVETKILEPKKKVKIFGCKYLNETDMNITHLDSKWFTNLVKSDAFKVRGHFRLQPKKKEGKWIKELIWINDFEKSGYTAPARKLTQTQ